MTQVKPIPDGYTSVTPHIIVHDCAAAIEFYKRAFGAEERCRMPGPDGNKIIHAEIKIGNAIVMLCDEFRDFGQTAPTTLGGTPSGIHLYVEDADAAFEKAVLAGATIEMPLQNMFWGDRYGKVVDPFGHSWSIATHIKDMDPREMAEAGKKAFCPN